MFGTQALLKRFTFAAWKLAVWAALFNVHVCWMRLCSGVCTLARLVKDFVGFECLSCNYFCGSFVWCEMSRFGCKIVHINFLLRIISSCSISLKGLFWLFSPLNDFCRQCDARCWAFLLRCLMRNVVVVYCDGESVDVDERGCGAVRLAHRRGGKDGFEGLPSEHDQCKDLQHHHLLCSSFSSWKCGDSTETSMVAPWDETWQGFALSDEGVDGCCC